MPATQVTEAMILVARLQRPPISFEEIAARHNALKSEIRERFRFAVIAFTDELRARQIDANTRSGSIVP